MDRLIKPELEVISMAFKRGQKCSQEFKLTNLMHTMSVAISLTTSNPSIFTFPQPFSIIPPLSTATFAVHLLKPRDQPPLSIPADEILVRASMLPTGKASQEDLRRLFSRPGPHIFKDAKVSVVFVGRQVAEHLLSPSGRRSSLDTEFLFSKAITYCDRSELNSLLRSGVKNGKARLVSLLIEAGADVINNGDGDGEDGSLLALAVRYGNADVLQTLIRSAGGSLAAGDENLGQVLHFAADMNRVDLMEILCLSFADLDLNSRDAEGKTALHVASIHGQIEALEFLISAGSEADVADDGGYTPLHYASERGDSDAVEFLLNHSVFSKHALTKEEKKTPFDLAVEKRNEHLYDVLSLGDDLLHEFARKGNAREIITKCLGNTNGSSAAKKKKKKAIDERDGNGWTLLHRVAFKGHLECVKLLVGRGSRVDSVDRAGYSPLLCAIEGGHVEVAVFLLSCCTTKGGLVMNSEIEYLKKNRTFLHHRQVKERA